jgi:NDP-sugar pyrophosphorylase family protein
MRPIVILAGGLGTRLGAVIGRTPKVLAPVCGTPFLHYLLHHIRRQGYTDVILSTGYLGEEVEAYARDGAAWDLHVRYVREEQPLGTGGALALVVDRLGLSDPFLAVNGDTFFSGSLLALERMHAAKPDALAVIALTQVTPADRYGCVRVDPATQAILSFEEKKPGATGTGMINTGLYLLDPAILAGLPRSRAISVEREVFPQSIGQGLYGCVFDEAFFLDIGTPEDYERAATLLPDFLKVHG